MRDIILFNESHKMFINNRIYYLSFDTAKNHWPNYYHEIVNDKKIISIIKGHNLIFLT